MPSSAVRASLSIVERVAGLRLSEPLRVRIGVATGLVVVGDLIGAGAAQEQAVVGETPNLAARLQALAEPNEIVIADATRRQIGGLFEISDLGPQALKGFIAEQRAWRVAGESGVASRFEALRSGATPLVGRDEEIDLLLRRWAQAKAGEGRVVLISAEPGIGKSRLAEAGQLEPAVRAWRKAGEQAVRRAANREAIEHFRRALALVEAQPEDVQRSRAELAILTQLAPPLMSVHGWSAPEVGEVVERAAEIGRRLESSAELAPAIANLWIFNTARGRFDRADEISGDLFRIARELGDDDILLQAHHCAWATRFSQGRIKEAAEHVAAGAALYDSKRHAHHRHLYLGHDPRACSLNFGASISFALGYPERARRLVIEGIDFARGLAHPPSLGNALWRACEVFALRGDVEATRATAIELIELTDVHGLPQPRVHAFSYLGWALARSGGTAEGLARLQEGERQLTAMGAVVHATFVLGLRADGLWVAGCYAEGLEQIDRALAVAGEGGEHVYLAVLHRIRAKLLVHARGASDPAVEASLQQALAIAQQQEAKGFELGAAVTLARLWVEAGRRDEARTLLAPLYAWFTEGFDTADLAKAKTLLADLG